jgi:predicted NBD/HSP70 family sugar kinase
MTYIGFDHHKKWTQAAAIDDQGKIKGRTNGSSPLLAKNVTTESKKRTLVPTDPGALLR